MMLRRLGSRIKFQGEWRYHTRPVPYLNIEMPRLSKCVNTAKHRDRYLSQVFRDWGSGPEATTSGQFSLRILPKALEIGCRRYECNARCVLGLGDPGNPE